MSPFTGKLIVGISSRALFDLTDSHQVYEQEGIVAYRRHQIENEENPLKPGGAYHLVKKLLNINELQKDPLVEVILLSRNSADTGLRVFNCIQAQKLAIKRAVFTSGRSPHAYGSAFGTHLFLSAHQEDVKSALQAGVAAAQILPETKAAPKGEQLRIAFDGDAVIFSDEAERIFQAEGLNAFYQSEADAANLPLSGGPFHGFLAALQNIQKLFPESCAPIRTALVTARSAPAHERVIRTLRAWDIRIDEALFLGGLDKTEFLNAFGADIYFDDQATHCLKAAPTIATGHVPHGIVNETGKES